MATKTVIPKLRIRTRSLVGAWLIIITPAIIGAALLSAQRIVMWILTAATLAGLLYPIAQIIAKYIPRALAILLTMIVLWGTIGYAVYSVLDNLNEQSKHLERDAPALIHRYQNQDSSLSKIARDAELDDRVRVFFNELPERLRGGSPEDTIRGVASRGVAILVINVLAIFFMLHSASLVRGLLGVLPEKKQQKHWADLLAHTYERTFSYLRGSLAMALTASLLTYALAQIADVPAPFPLAVFMGVFDLVPVFGVVLGGLPVVVLAFASSEKTGILLLIVFIAYQLFESFLLQPRVEKRSVRPGPFISLIAIVGGLEAFGVGGMFLSLVLATVAVTFLDEIFPDTARTPGPETDDIKEAITPESA